MNKYSYIMLFALPMFIVFNLASTILADLTPQKYTSDPPEIPYSYIECDEIAPFNRELKTLDGQSQEWRSKMRELGQKMEQSKVRHIYFVHGTFAGNDPTGIVDLIKCVYPKLSFEWETHLRNIAKQNVNKMFTDTGNYHPEYIKLFRQAIGSNIPGEPLDWSSENNHMARLRGSVKLVNKLYENINSQQLQNEDRILLIGHSHAGQLFALLTNYLAQSYGVQELLEIAGENNDDFNEKLQKIREIKLDIVTFGAPPRYGWGKAGERADYCLINIINHRAEGHLACLDSGFRLLIGILNTRDGDYVQQWGIAGTDMIDVESMELNKQLDGILGEGINLNVWLENAKAGMRVPNYGNKTFLVDYKDKSSNHLPNFFKTVLGHGTYTKYEKMLFNTNLIVDALYSNHE